MSKQNKHSIIYKIMLLAVALIWGSSLVVVKGTGDHVTPNLLLALRFSIAFIILSVIFRKKLMGASKQDIVAGVVIGIFLFLAYSSQTIGVMWSMPGKSAFLSSAYCVFVPFLFWATGGNKPYIRNIFAAILCLMGIGLCSVTTEFSIVPGDLMAILSSVLFAAHIVSVAKCGRGRDPILMTILQFGSAAICAWIVSLLSEGVPKHIPLSGWISILYLAIFCTTIALLLQNVGQKYVAPASAAILLSLESVFGIIFSAIIYGEAITVKLAVGFLCIFISVLVSEVEIPFTKCRQ